MISDYKIKKVKILRYLYLIESELSENYKNIYNFNYTTIKNTVSTTVNKYNIGNYDIGITFDEKSYTVIIKTEYGLGIKTIILNEGITIHE